MKKRSRWLRLDNAAKIYPAARRRNWLNIYRVSVTLKEEIDPDILALSLEQIRSRFPSICVKIRAGMFWYYVEEVENLPPVQQEWGYPCTRMKFRQVKECAFRVLYYKNRISAEFFHALTDGTGALIFLKTLTARYLINKHGINIPAEKGVLDISKRAVRSELEDCFLKHYGKVSAGRKDPNAFIIRGKSIKQDFTPLVSGVADVKQISAKAKEYGVSITVFLCAVMIDALQEIQEKLIESRNRHKCIKVLIPVNLRNIFPSDTLRNFALYVMPGIEPKMGHYSFDEIIKCVYHQMGLEITAKELTAKITTNVKDELNPLLKIVPLPLKNMVMKAVYNISGEPKTCIGMSNMGNVDIPDEMRPYIDRFDFILTPQAILPGNCSIISYNGKMVISFVRNIEESELERLFFTRLVKMGIKIRIESNSRAQEEICHTV